MESTANIPAGVYFAWWTGLIVVVALVPLAIYLLHRTLRAALSIRRYLAEMEQAGARIAANTGAAGALQETRDGAGALLSGAAKLERHSGQFAEELTRRAQNPGDES